MWMRKKWRNLFFVILRLVFPGEDLLQEKADRIVVASLRLRAAEKAVKSTGFHNNMQRTCSSVLV
jgi:hypothetical protein